MNPVDFLKMTSTLSSYGVSGAKPSVQSLDFSLALSRSLSRPSSYLIEQLAKIINLSAASQLGVSSLSSSSTTGSGLSSPGLTALLNQTMTNLQAKAAAQVQKTNAEKMTTSSRKDQTTSSQSRHDFDELIDQAAERYKVDPDLVRAVVTAESDFDPTCVSTAGAMGLMQLMPETAEDLGISDPFDPAQNIDGGTRYLSKMLARFDGNLNKALAAYNWGPSNVERGGSLPAETRNYLKKVARFRGLYAQGFNAQA